LGEHISQSEENSDSFKISIEFVERIFRLFMIVMVNILAEEALFFIISNYAANIE